MARRLTTTEATMAFDPKAIKAVLKLFAEAKELYAPEGEFMAGTEAAISRGAKRSVASGVQQLASAGLGGTSIVGGLGKKYEEEVGMPTRARATTARLGALAGLLQAEAGAELQMAGRTTTQEIPTPMINLTRGPAVSTVPVQQQTIRPQQTIQQREGFGRSPHRMLPTLNLLGLRRERTPAPAPVSSKPLGSFYGDFMKTAPKRISGPAGTPSLANIYSRNFLE